jgi:hypothetical protein
VANNSCLRGHKLQIHSVRQLDLLEGCHEITRKVLKSSPWAHHLILKYQSVGKAPCSFLAEESALLGTFGNTCSS